MQRMEPGSCPLCSSDTTCLYHRDMKRDYYQCQVCSLVFVPSRFWLNREAEKAVYDLHENDADDQGYRSFLARLVSPMLDRLGRERLRGLDFGCGPGPALSHMLYEHGHQVALYDPFYHNDPSLLATNYDFICATEVVEHLHSPGEELGLLFALLKSGGWLGIMTKLVIDKAAFSNWHYTRDLTHVCFFSRETFLYIASSYAVTVSFVGNDVVLFQKNS